MSFDTFHVKIIEGRNVDSSHSFLQVKPSFNSQLFKSKVNKTKGAPKYDEEFKVFTSRAEGEVVIRLYEKTVFSKTLLGSVTLNLKNYADGSKKEEWMTLMVEKKKKDTPLPELYLQCYFSGPPAEKGKDGKEEKTPTEKGSKDQPKVQEPKKTGPVRIEDNYKLGKELGRGAFSVVREGIRKANNKKYAIKCISKKLIDKKELTLLEREIDIMKKLQHPNIIQLMEVIDTPDTLYLVLENAPGGELFDAIVNKGSYSEVDAANIVRQILEAIKYCHEQGIAHRDLKPENLLLGEGKKDFIKIADFGLSKEFGSDILVTSCGTPDYVAPEVLSGEPYDMSVDIWSIGVITYVLLCGYPPFYGEVQKELFENILAGNYDFPEPEWNEVSEEAKDFIKKILVVDPQKRATAEQCLTHPWIKENTEPKEKPKEMKRLQSFSVQKFEAYNKKYREANRQDAQAPDVKNE
jgi:calcium/calmodulin-dependent protein kinase I